jgi:hypothetical protein
VALGTAPGTVVTVPGAAGGGAILAAILVSTLWRMSSCSGSSASKLSLDCSSEIILPMVAGESAWSKARAARRIFSSSTISSTTLEAAIDHNGGISMPNFLISDSLVE